MDRGYTYDCVILRDDDGFHVTFPQVPEASAEGKTREDAIRNASEALKGAMHDYERAEDKKPPRYKRSAEVVSVSVVLTAQDAEDMQCETFSEAARSLGVKPPRITALVKAGVLDVRVVKGRRMVTSESVERYRESDRRPGRPRKQAGEDEE